jgi:hypothetical protein
MKCFHVRHGHQVRSNHPVRHGGGPYRLYPHWRAAAVRAALGTARHCPRCWASCSRTAVLSLPSSAPSSPASWHRLFVSGSDRSCEKWMADYRIAGIEELQQTRSPNQPRTPARKAGVLDLRKWMRPRDRLSAGGRWIRTFGSPR